MSNVFKSLIRFIKFLGFQSYLGSSMPTRERLEISEEFYKSRLPSQRECPYCGCKSLTGNVHESNCVELFD